MGQRANLILVNDGKYDLYYSHWCANTLPGDLFWGPEEALSFIKQQQLTDEWLDDRWAEGGVMMDLDRKFMLWYGGEDILYDIPLRRQLFALMQPLWSGWEQQWAKGGIIDMARYLNYPLEQVRSVEYTADLPSFIEPEQKGGFIRTIASLVFSNGEMRIFPIHATFDEYLLAGESFLQAIDPALGQEKLVVAESTEDFPDQGFHLDMVRQTLDIWYAGAESDLIPHVKKCWAGWTVTDLGDQYEQQSTLTDNAVVFGQPSELELTERLRRMLVRANSSSPVDTVKRFAEMNIQMGKKVEVNPLALFDHPQDLDLSTRAAKFEYALSQVRG